MKSKLLFLFLIPTQFLTAQTFTEVTGTPFQGVWSGSIAISDVNGDEHNDVLIVGQTGLGTRIAKLYTNDGTGSFTEMTPPPFDSIEVSSVAFSDVNGDGHDDVLITGWETSLEVVTKLYTSDGTGTFTEMTGTPFVGLVWGSIVFSDVNGDGHKDVLLTGRDRLHKRITKLYANDGTGTFTEMTCTPFVDVFHSSVAFSDINGDGYDDVLITGQKDLAGHDLAAKLYTNDGTGTFTEMTGTPFVSVRFGSIAFSDINGDGHDDVLITGQGSSSERIAKLYTNDGTGTFAEMTDTPFVGVEQSSIAFSDVNGDGHEDVLITGQSSPSQHIAKLYTNDGTGAFTEMAGTPFVGVRSGFVVFSDVSGDGHKDVLILGGKYPGTLITKLYISDGFSSIKDLNNGISLDFVLFPNPATSSTLLLSYDSPETSEVTINVYDTNGRLLSQQKEYALHGKQTFSIDIATLPKGNYSLELDNGKRKGGARFIVQ